MDNRKRNIIWILLLIFVVSTVLSLATYAYFTAKEYRYGQFNVDITSNGVDTLQFKNKDGQIRANIDNFDKNSGHNVVGEAVLNTILETSNDISNTYCYTVDLVLPDEVVFEYSYENLPELMIEVSKSVDGVNYETIVENFDATNKTGVIHIPEKMNSDSFVNKIYTTKKIERIDSWKATLTLVWYKDIDQSRNFYDKKYSAQLKANRVEC